MDGDVDALIEQRVLDLAGEQALAADLAQRAVQHAVAGGLDDHDLEGVGGQVMRGGQPVARFMRLRERQRRAARADPKGAVGGG